MKRAVIALTCASGCMIGGPSSVVGRWGARRVVDSTVCVKTQIPGALPPDVGFPPAGTPSDGAWPPAAAPSTDAWPTPGAPSSEAWPTPGAPSTESWPIPGAQPANGTASDGRTNAGNCEQLISIGRDVPGRGFSSLAFTFAAPGYIQWRGSDGYVGHGLALNSYFEYLRGRGGFAIGGRIGGHLAAGFGDRIAVTMPISVIAHAGGQWGSVYAGAGYSPVALEQQYVGEGEMKTPLPETYHFNSVHGFIGARFWLTRTLERGFSLSPEFRVETFGDATLTSLTANFGLHL